MRMNNLIDKYCYELLTLFFIASPIISLPQGPMLANLGSNFTFPECVVVSEPKAKVTWKRGYGSFPENRVHVADGNLTIIKVRVEDEGFYVCTAENYLGQCINSSVKRSYSMRVLKLKHIKDIPANTLQGVPIHSTNFRHKIC